MLVGGLALAACQPPEPPEPPAPPARRLPGEFEPQQAIAIGMAQMVQFHPQALVEIVSALRGELRILGLVEHAAEERAVATLLHERGIDPLSVEFVRAPVHTMWARDYGPLFLQAGERSSILDPTFKGTADNPRDGLLPQLFARWLQLECESLELLLEGGNVLSNGRGLVLSSTRAIAINLQEGGSDARAIQQRLAAALAADRVAYLRPLAGEGTAHVDMFCAFLSADQVVVARIDPERDPVNAAQLDESARSLAGLAVGEGKLRVLRLEMPPAEDGVWRSYTNILIANQVVLVPAYGGAHADGDAAALAFYTEHFPGRRVVAIAAESLAQRGGSLHCVSFHVPAFVPLPPIGG